MARLLATALFATVLAIGAAGCGGGDSEGAADTQTEAAATIDAGTTEETVGTDADETAGGAGADAVTSALAGECSDIANAVSAYSAAVAAAAATSGDDSSGDLDQTAAGLEAFADEAPEEIRDAYRTIAEAFSAYAAVLDDVDLSSLQSGATPDPQVLAKLLAAGQQLGDADVQAASQEISTWVAANCSK